MILEVKGLYSGYGKILVLKDINITVGYRETVCILGANGAGKTTLINTISGMIKVLKGSVIFDGKDITNLAPEKRVKLGLVQIPEGRKIFPKLTVLENIEIGGFPIKDKDYLEKTRDFIFSTFPILYQRRFQKAGTLSGGEQQMLSIARGLMSKPKLLMLDEPSMGLSVKFVDIIFDIIHKLKEKISILIVEQNAMKALEVADRGYVLEVGQVFLSGDKSFLLNNEDIRKAYLGV